jgi:hypothetical protein
MPTTLILAAIELYGMAAYYYATYSAFAFVVNFAVSQIVTKLFSSGDQDQQNNAVRQQVPPDTTNALPIVYGNAWLGGRFVDAVLSTDGFSMFYTIAISNISENGTFTFDKTKFYYGDRLITFDTVEPARVLSLTDGAGNVETKINGNLFIYLYRSTNAGVITNLDNGGTAAGSALPSVIMGPSAPIAAGQQWPTTNRQMNGTAFAVVKLVYNAEITTGLQPITFYGKQYLNGQTVAKPGDVWLDYMTDVRYGGAIDVADINTTSATALNTYADQTITFNNNLGVPSTQPRYRINGVIDPGKNVLNNVNNILVACDSWMSYNAALGQWSIIINKAESATFAFDDNNIIGEINTTISDITQSINIIEAKFPNSLNRDQLDYCTIETPAILLYPNEPVNKYSTTYDLTNDSVQAQYLANRTLEQAREDLIVSFSTTYQGIQIDAGDVVTVTNSAYGWSNKLFRVMKVNETSLPDGNLGAAVELNEYNAQVYDDKDITQYTPAANSNLVDSTFFSTLFAPTITDIVNSVAVPSFSVQTTVPATGRTTLISLFYTLTATPTNADWTLFGTLQSSDSAGFPSATLWKFNNVVLPAATYYFAYKVSNETGQSILSPLSTAFSWSPNTVATTVGNNFLASFSPAAQQVPVVSGSPVFTGIAPQLYGVAGAAAIDFVVSQTDTDALFVNNTWRIGGSSTTGYADIVASAGLTIANPTDGGTFALFPAPTGLTTTSAHLDVPVRYKDTGGVVYQGATPSIQFVQVSQGVDGSKTAQANLYQWSTAAPANPSGTSTWTWATSTQSAYTGTGGWTIAVPANPGTPGIRLWLAQKSFSDAASATTTTVNWTSGYSVSDITQNGANGVTGVQSASPIVYQWAATIPSGPTGTSTYTWATAVFTAPASWTLTPGSSTPGFTLWAARVQLTDSASVTTSTINWTTATISAAGYAGATGATGLSARICFARVASNPTPTSGTITTSGGASFPTSGQSTTTWGFAATWSATDPSPSSTNSLYQSDGIYDATAGTTSWSTPYISSLKVGTLSAITANMGTITAGNITSAEFRTAATGKRIELNWGADNFLQFYNAAGTLIGEIGGTTGTAYFPGATTLSGPAVWGVNSGAAPGVAGTSDSDPGVNGQSTTGYGVYGQSQQDEGVRGLGTVKGAGNHGVRGININGTSVGVSTAGLVGAANGYDFYADGGGINYGPFTGSHDVLIPVGSSIDVGNIVFDVQCIQRKNISNTIFEVAISNQANQPALGIFAANNGLLANVKPSAFIEKMEEIPSQFASKTIYVMTPTYEAQKNNYQICAANAVGEGQVLVCNEGGNINAGDLIVTSSIAGKGMKQADDIVRNYTVAKARESVTFTGTNDIQLIACIYLCG